MTRAVWIVTLLCIQPCVLAWQDGKLTFAETAPVPTQIAKLLESQPRAPTTYPLLLEADGIKVEAESLIVDKTFEATITVTKGNVKTIIRNPRADQQLNTNDPNYYSPLYSEVVSMMPSPDQRTLYAGSRGGGLRVIDMGQGKEIGLLRDPSLTKFLEFGAHSGAVTRLWSVQNPQDDSQWWLVSAARDATVKVWDGRSGALVFKAGAEAAVDLVWLQNGNELLAAANNMVFRVAPLRPKMIQKFAGSTRAITTLAVQNNVLWAKTTDDTVMSWNLETSQRQQMYSHIMLAAASADGKRVAVKFGDDQIRLLDSRDGGVIARFQTVREDFNETIEFNRLHLSNNGRYLALTRLFLGHLTNESYYTEFVKVWDTKTGRIIFNKEFAGASIGWSSDGRYLLGQGLTYNYRYALYDFTKQKIVSEYSNLSSTSQLQWTSKGVILIGAKEFGDKTIILGLYSAIREKRIRQIGKISVKKINGLQMVRSADSKKLALRFWNTLLIWDVENFRLLSSKTLADDGDDHNPSYALMDFVMRFSDDDKSLLTWDTKSGPGVGRVWNATTLKEEGTADCKKEVLGFLKFPRAVICNDGDQLTTIPFAN